jgi:hypothetical protein
MRKAQQLRSSTPRHEVNQGSFRSAIRDQTPREQLTLAPTRDVADVVFGGLAADEQPVGNPGSGSALHERAIAHARSPVRAGTNGVFVNELVASGLQLDRHPAMVARPPLIGIGIEGAHG